MATDPTVAAVQTLVDDKAMALLQRDAAVALLRVDHPPPAAIVVGSTSPYVAISFPTPPPVVTPPPPGSPPPVDPGASFMDLTGFTVFDDDCNAVDGGGWGKPSQPNGSIIVDASAPGNVLDITYPAGQTAGYASFEQEHGLPGGKLEFYLRGRMKVSANFRGHKVSGVNKWAYAWSNDGQYGTPSVYFDLHSYDEPTFEPQVRTQDAPNFINYGPNKIPTRLNRDTWYWIESYVKMNTMGKADGIIRIAVNKVLVAEHTGVRIINAMDTQHYWDHAQIENVWGGNDGVKIATPQHLYIDKRTLAVR